MPPDIEAALAKQEEYVEIWPDMVPAVSLFFGMGRTQWRWLGVGMGGAFRTGLDYAALPVVAQAFEVSLSPEVMRDLQTMEAGALEAWSRR